VIVVPFDPAPLREGVRASIAKGLLAILSVVIVALFAAVYLGLLPASELMKTVLPQLITLIATVLGFYFGAERSKS
jgi:hypothetical protein